MSESCAGISSKSAFRARGAEQAEVFSLLFCAFGVVSIFFFPPQLSLLLFRSLPQFSRSFPFSPRLEMMVSARGYGPKGSPSSSSSLRKINTRKNKSCVSKAASRPAARCASPWKARLHRRGGERGTRSSGSHAVPEGWVGFFRLPSGRREATKCPHGIFSEGEALLPPPRRVRGRNGETPGEGELLSPQK